MLQLHLRDHHNKCRNQLSTLPVKKNQNKLFYRTDYCGIYLMLVISFRSLTVNDMHYNINSINTLLT